MAEQTLVDIIANVIRTADGEHTKGAGAVAEAVVAYLENNPEVVLRALGGEQIGGPDDLPNPWIFPERID